MCECHLPIKIDVSANGTKVSDRMVSSAKEFLRQHAAKFDDRDEMSPIFLYLAFQGTNSISIAQMKTLIDISVSTVFYNPLGQSVALVKVN